MMEALRFYSGMVVQQPRPEDAGENEMFSRQLWWDVCADIHRQVMAKAYPAHAKEIEAELKKRNTLSSAEKLGASARNLIILDEWRKLDGL